MKKLIIALMILLALSTTTAFAAGRNGSRFNAAGSCEIHQTCQHHCLNEHYNHGYTRQKKSSNTTTRYTSCPYHNLSHQNHCWW